MVVDGSRIISTYKNPQKQLTLDNSIFQLDHFIISICP